MRLQVTFTSEYIGVACKLFAENFCSIEEVGLKERSRIAATYRFDDDTHIRDIRSWGSYAVGCGLVSSFSCHVE